jgi:hypothetical protein
VPATGQGSPGCVPAHPKLPVSEERGILSTGDEFGHSTDHFASYSPPNHKQ